MPAVINFVNAAPPASPRAVFIATSTHCIFVVIQCFINPVSTFVNAAPVPTYINIVIATSASPFIPSRYAESELESRRRWLFLLFLDFLDFLAFRLEASGLELRSRRWRSS